MNLEPLSGPTTSLVRLALDAAQMRHRVHVTNIANASVPAYTPVRLDFGQTLNEARAQLVSADPGRDTAAPADLAQEVVPATDGRGQPLGSVELDVEMAEMVHNTLAYQSLMKGLSRHLAILSMAVSDGRR